ncbi:hypothetical protein [Fictibacillus phosphorivorans]|uniref:hypothetical protein n=1 Tax=Fictibacillus phosphorivorans TaxID=1221500 RepID=UPI002040EACE|nr:hypothetical protein [Fictibacillus phosphorivorans]MCM3719212.1 hypothetical protein [Fictibacillus phosphorivorans]MCM3776834.1 hypothetical protein [Fictibacillus phosphorivorans]
MKKGLVLVIICGYFVAGTSAIALAPTLSDSAVNLSNPISTTIISNKQVLYDEQNPLQ